VGLERSPLSLARITEELLEWKSRGSGSSKLRLTAVGIRCADHATPSIRKSSFRNSHLFIYSWLNWAASNHIIDSPMIRRINWQNFCECPLHLTGGNRQKHRLSWRSVSLSTSEHGASR
jgi:hypothetical protein